MSPPYKETHAKSFDHSVKRVGIFIRVSTELQVDAESPAVHEHRARAYAASRGWHVAEIYRLEAVSGKTTIEHPETVRMLEDIRRGHISGVIISKLARLGRNAKELLQMADTFRELEADLVSMAESIDTSTPAGRLFYTMIAGMAQWEREEIAARLKAAIETRAKMGKPINGKSVIGYHWVEGKLVPKESERRLRVRVLELFKRLRRFHAVAEELKREGFTTRKGNPLSGAMVRSLITDTTAIGIHRSYVSCVRSGKRQLKPKEDWVFNEVEPIVERELWELCNQILNANTSKGWSQFTIEDLADVPALVKALHQPHRPFDVWLSGQLSMDARNALAAYFSEDAPADRTLFEGLLLHEFNFILRRACIFDPDKFAGITLRPETEALKDNSTNSANHTRLNRLLFEDAYPTALSRNYKRSPGRQTRYLFGNLLWCGCNSKIYVKSNSPIWFTCSSCRNRIDRAALEQLFLAQVEKVFSNPVNVEALVKESEKASGETIERISALEREKAQIAQRIEKLFELYEKNSISSDGFGKRYHELEHRQKQLDEEITQTKGKANPANSVKHSIKEVSSDAESICRMWPGWTFAEKKALVDSLVSKIVIREDTIDFHFADAPSLAPVAKRLCKLIATQPFSHMIITCAKPAEPPKRQTPSKRICPKYAPLVEKMVKEGLSGKIIFERLRRESEFDGAYPTLIVFVREVRSRLFPGQRYSPRRAGACEPYRELITNLIKDGIGPKGVYEQLKSNTPFAGSQAAVAKFFGRVKRSLVAQGVAIRDRGTCAQHREYIERRTKQGAMPMRIFRELQQKFGFEGTYRAVYICIDRVKKEALKAGLSIKTGRSVCFQHAEMIYSMIKKGEETRRIWDALQHVQFSGTYPELVRFVWRYKQELKAQGVTFPERRNSCSKFRSLIAAKIAEGMSAKQIFEALKTEVQFTGGYVRLRRYVKLLSQNGA